MKNLTFNELKERRDKVAYAIHKEYTTRGNTPRCQELFREYEALEDSINASKLGAEEQMIPKPEEIREDDIEL